MTVEVATTIAGLNETYPLATDPKSEGDDHIRLIKTILKSNLSNVNNTSDANKPVSTATQTALDAKVTGPATTTDNTIARYDGSTGKLIQSSSATLDDSGNATFSGNVAIQGAGLSQNGVNLPVGVTAGMTMTSATSHLAGNASVLRMAIADGSSPAGVSVHNIHDGTYSSQEVAISTSVGGIEPTTERLRFYKDGKILATNSPGLGYGAGSGGTATQPVSKSEPVTVNKPSGQITMHNAALAAGVEVEFIVNCSVIAASDSVLVNVSGGVLSFTNYRLKASIQGAGQFVVGIENRTGGSLSEAVVIQFNVIKGSTT